MQSACPNYSEDSSEDCHALFNLSDFEAETKPKFKFSPQNQRLSKSVNNSFQSSLSDSSNNSAKNFHKTKRKHVHKRNSSTKLPPLGIFWDIENCQVPKNKSASAVVQRIREYFLGNYREAEFLVVCDVKKERPHVVQELHDSQVNLIHVLSTSKNAADEKLRQSLRRFAEIYTPPSCIVLISSDINFAADLSDLRYRKKIRVILVHNTNVADALILCANEHHYYSAITEGIPAKDKQSLQSNENVSSILQVSNLPRKVGANTIKNRLNFLTSNCGGRVIDIIPEVGIATIRFCNQDFANRAQKRIQGEDVFGNKIKAVTPSLRNYTGRKIKGSDSSQSLQGPGGRNAQDGSSKDTKRYPYDLLGQEFGAIRGTNSPLNDYNYSSSSSSSRRPRTPAQDNFQSLSNRVHKTSGSSDFSDDFKPDQNGARTSQQSVDLIISNLDPSFSVKELRRLLTNMLKEYAMILSLNVIVQTDGTPLANIKVNNQQAAQFVISQLHRQKLGHKRIVISYAQSNSPDLDQLRAMVISILQEVPDNHMPLFKFIELLESRYHCTVSVSDVNKLKDICKITENLGSRIISFTQEVKTSPPPNLSKTLLPYCTVHCANGLPNLGWCELNTVQTPNVMVSLKPFTTKLNSLLNIHMGSMPLLSFQQCYEQECQEPLPVDFNGVPLEHLISCVPNIEIKCSGPSKNIKIIKREIKSNEQTDEENAMKAVPPSLAPNISLLCRELVDLLKTTDKCQLLLSKFIPAYHHHFGRQCHVADYGYTKLLDLFESMSHVVQIMGDGTRKIITLSHSAQMRRFTSDLLRVLKVQPAKQISISDYSSAYEKVMNKQFNPVDYGLCTFQDLIREVPENIIVIAQNDDDVFIAVPKREQTAKEVMRTKQFAMEVIDILRHSPNCTMLFNKFVPAYHHHFGHQCRVADYGFSKLIELFEAIPDVVKIQELPDGDRCVSLTLAQSLKILGAQIMSLIKNAPGSSLALEDLPKMYLKECGYPLKPQTYDCETLMEVMEKISDFVQVLQTSSGSMLFWVDSDFMSTLKIRTFALLSKPPYCKEFNTFQYEYQSRYNCDISLNNLKQLRNIISLSSLNDTNYIALTDLFVLGAQLYNVLYLNGGSALFSNLNQLYLQYFGKNLRLNDYNINSLEDLYEQFDFLFFVCRYKKNVLALNKNLAEYQIAVPSQICNSSSSVAKKWPPPPVVASATPNGASALQSIVPQTVKKVSPPKPDTPPTPSINPWGVICRKSHIDDHLNLSIQLPIIQNPQLMGNPYDLISPAKQLYSLNRNPWGNAPDPTELPMPDKLMGKGIIFDDSNDSGVNSKLENSPSDNEIDLGACGSGAMSRLTRYLTFDQ